MHPVVLRGWGRYRRPAAGIVDQGLSSLTNFATTILGARYASPSRFGTLALALSVAYMVTILARGLTAEPIMAMCPRLHGAELKGRERDAVSIALVLGVASGLVTCALVLVPGDAMRDFAWVGVCLPAVLLQDSLRFVGFARGKPGAALIADLAWMIVQFGMILVLIALHRTTLHWIVVSWGAGALAGAVAGAAALRLYELGSPRRWLHFSSSYSFWVLPQLAISQGTDQGTTLVFVTVFGTSALGGIRAMQMFIRPVFVFMLAMQALLVPSLTRRLMARGQKQLLKDAKRLAIWIGALAAASASVAVLEGHPLARIVFGARYVGYAKFLLPFAVGSVFHACSVMPAAALRALQRGRQIFIVQLGSSVAALTAVVTTSLVSTVYATAWAVAVQGVAAAVLGWVALATAKPVPSGRPATQLGDGRAPGLTATADAKTLVPPYIAEAT